MKTLEAGSPAPQFELNNQDGSTVRLKDLRGRRVLVYFYPKAMTPGCTQQACSLRDTLGELQQRGVEVIGISPDPVKRLKKFAERDNLNFTLLADESHAVADGFGVWGPKSFMGRKFDGVHRISFLIDAKGVIEHVFADFKAKDHHELVLKYLDAGADEVVASAAPKKTATPKQAATLKATTKRAPSKKTATKSNEAPRKKVAKKKSVSSKTKKSR